jgi:AraC-like DNA-binding protein
VTISVSVIRGLVGYVTSTGVSETELLSRAGFDPAILQEPTARVGPEVQDRLFQAAQDLTGDPAFGLRMGEHAPIGAFGVPAYMSLHAGTLFEAAGVLFRYHRVIADCPAPYFQTEGERLALVYNYVRTTPASNRIRAEYGLGILLRIGRMLAGSDLPPLDEARFEHPAPPYAAEYARLFGDRVVFDHPHTALVMSGIVDRPLLFADAHVFAALRKQADAELLEATESSSFAERVRSLIVSRYADSEPTMEFVARRFSMSPRSLRRRLEAEGTTFSAVSDAALGQVARDILDEPHTTVQEAAYRMGFSEPSSFHRAFKRWTGTTPSAYRARVAR